jgi:DNA polymerase (family 10)
MRAHLNLDGIYLRKAKDMGIEISIGTDAHSVSERGWMRFGVGIARIGWLNKGDIINTLSCPKVTLFEC